MGTSLEFKFLQNRLWFRKLCVFYKTVKEQPPKYLFDLIPSNNNSYQTNSQNLVIPQFKARNNFLLLNSFFPSAVVE